MNALATLKTIQTLQGAFQVLTALHLSAYLYPPGVTIPDGEIYDFIVVGAGTAGSVVASRLAEDNNAKVLLIEAGEDPPMESNIPSMMIFLEKSHSDWNYSIEDDGYTQRCHKKHLTDLMLGKMLGGSSALNYMLYSQGSKHDYETWSEIINDNSWNWDNVSKYFQKSTTFEEPLADDSYAQNFKGPMIVSTDRRPMIKDYLKAFQELGHNVVSNVNTENNIGYRGQMYTIGNGRRQSTAYSYIHPKIDNINLHILKNSSVTKIIFDENKNAVGVQVLQGNQNSITIKATKEIIVSAGAINTPKLLMLSGIGPKEQLEERGVNVISDLPVGKNFQDQIAIVIIHNMTKREQSPVPRNPYLYPAITFTGYVSLNDLNQPDYQTTNYINIAEYVMMFCTYTYGFIDDICNELFAYESSNQILWTMVTNLHPKSRGEVLLKSTDFSDPPIIHPGYFSNDEDLENHVKYIKDFMKVVNSSVFREMGAIWENPNLENCKNFEIGSMEYWKCYALCMMTSQRHYSGTCAIGSVVDSKLFVKGVQKLRIVDASVFPKTVSGDPLAAVVMIGEKAASLIKAEHGLNSNDN